MCVRIVSSIHSEGLNPQGGPRITPVSKTWLLRYDSLKMSKMSIEKYESGH